MKPSPRRLGWAALGLAIAALSLVACRGGGEEPAAATRASTPPAVGRISPPDPPAPSDLRRRARIVEGRLPATPAGHLAYVGSDGNLYVLDPVSGATAQITRDASSANTGLGIFHTGMAWARSGELVFARTDVESFKSSLWITVPGRGRPTRLATRAGILIYASWSPSPCAKLTCSRLATVTDADGEPGGRVALTVVEVGRGLTTRRLHLERGGQIYFSWGGGNTLVRHLIDSRRHALERLGLADGRATPIEGSPGPFFAPAFAGGRVVYAVVGKAGIEPRVTVGARAVVIRVPPDARRVAFALSPDGSRLAYAVRGSASQTPDPAFNQTRIVELASGKLSRVGPPTLWTKAFYWSPDGRRLAYLTWLDTGINTAFQWRTFDAVTEADRGFAAFEPTGTFQTLVSFFDQFGQSHNVWSPDGRYLAYASVEEGGEQVWLIDTRGNGKRRILAADGVVAAFSWGR